MNHHCSDFLNLVRSQKTQTRNNREVLSEPSRLPLQSTPIYPVPGLAFGRDEVLVFQLGQVVTDRSFGHWVISCVRILLVEVAGCDPGLVIDYLEEDVMMLSESFNMLPEEFLSRFWERALNDVLADPVSPGSVVSTGHNAERGTGDPGVAVSSLGDEL